jgi:hypothetical protein
LEDEQIINDFKAKVEERNIVYISRNLLQELLGGLSYAGLLQKAAIRMSTSIC